MCGLPGSQLKAVKIGFCHKPSDFTFWLVQPRSLLSEVKVWGSQDLKERYFMFLKHFKTFHGFKLYLILSSLGDHEAQGTSTKLLGRSKVGSPRKKLNVVVGLRLGVNSHGEGEFQLTCLCACWSGPCRDLCCYAGSAWLNPCFDELCAGAGGEIV